MDLYNKPVKTRCVAADALIESEPCYVYWLLVSVTTYLTPGHVYIRDGFEATAPVVAHVYDAIGQHYLFIPPFKCSTGLFIDVDAAITCVSIGYLPVEVVTGKERQ